MSFILVSTQIRLECGPTIVGDEFSDPELMGQLNACKVTEFGNNFSEWKTDDPPRVVLNKLASFGYQLRAMAGIGQTCIWTLFKPSQTDS
ncbi:GTP cyclohydrolase 1 feedback regulatory protein-like protein [Leptotrombidium deliense]|uniref:GTP cyclohydrolase 1 feedback regulatory protein n=1 Tax=Leptotrombidium deliense TaxID=299467 RepID=A0A443SCA8_9ACAR|nr:GTP cyclohydrolase 1 feedback regulatory protein-like protein [Leptotrombidium deliense]